MTTTTPYSDEWREHTRSRMRALGLDPADIGKMANISSSAVRVAVKTDGFALSHEFTGPIDELLDKLEAASDAHAVEHGTRKLEALHAGEAVRVERIAVSLDPITNHEVRR